VQVHRRHRRSCPECTARRSRAARPAARPYSRSHRCRPLGRPGESEAVSSCTERRGTGTARRPADSLAVRHDAFPQSRVGQVDGVDGGAPIQQLLQRAHLGPRTRSTTTCRSRQSSHCGFAMTRPDGVGEGRLGDAARHPVVELAVQVSGGLKPLAVDRARRTACGAHVARSLRRCPFPRGRWWPSAGSNGRSLSVARSTRSARAESPARRWESRHRPPPCSGPRPRREGRGWRRDNPRTPVLDLLHSPRGCWVHRPAGRRRSPPVPVAVVLRVPSLAAGSSVAGLPKLCARPQGVSARPGLLSRGGHPADTAVWREQHGPPPSHCSFAGQRPHCQIRGRMF
jgi:hypothetical protein